MAGGGVEVMEGTNVLDGFWKIETLCSDSEKLKRKG
jgi:hypothetical protein